MSDSKIETTDQKSSEIVHNVPAHVQAEQREYIKAGSERLAEDVLKPASHSSRPKVEIYRDTLVEITKRYKALSLDIHKELCPNFLMPFVFCPNETCKNRRTAIECAEIVIAGGSDGKI